MRRFFNPLPQRMAGIVACAMIILACAGSEARSAIITETRATMIQALAGWQYLGLNVQDADCIGQSLAEMSLPDYAPLPEFTPDDIEIADATPSTDNAIARNETTHPNPANIDASDDRASQSSDPNGYSDYYRFKFGHFDRRYSDSATSDNGDKKDAANDNGTQSLPKTGASESTGKNSNNNDSNREMMPADGSNSDKAKSNGDVSDASNSEAANSDNGNVEVAKSNDDAAQAEAYNLDFFRYRFGEYGQRFGKMFNLKPIEAPSSEPAKSDNAANTSETSNTGDAAKTDDMPNSDICPKTDESPNSDGATIDECPNTDEVSKSDESSNNGESAEPSTMPKDDNTAEQNIAEQNAGEQARDDAAGNDADISKSIEKYYGYRHESMEDRYGRDANSDAQPVSGDDNAPAADDCQSSNESTGNDAADNSVLARTLLDVASRWASEFSANWQLNMPQFQRMLNWVY